MKTQLPVLPAALALLAGAGLAFAQGAAFTYQGRLTAGTNAASGSYDLVFEIYADSGGSEPAGTAITNSATAVTNGLFMATLDFGAGSFPGASRWLGISVRTNGNGAFTALRPVQELTPAPYAVTAESAEGLTGPLPAGSLSGTYGNALSFTNATNHFAGDGSGLTGVNAVTLGGQSAAAFWSTNGNTGANPANGAFLGTKDLMPLELRVDGARALRLEPSAFGPNVIGGATNNALGAGLSGAVIGGGVYNYIDVVSSNSVISGGATNTIQDSAAACAILGGVGNVIQTAATASIIGGGEGNLVESDADDATIGGGNSNSAGGPSEAIGGGSFNTASGYAATIPGGAGNTAAGDYSFAAGADADAATDGSFVWADSIGYGFSSSTANDFSVRATGGARFVSGVDASGNPNAGVSLAAGGGSWSSLSDRASKENLVAVDALQVLDSLARVPISTWNYKSQAEDVRHIGPMAQDFFSAFGVGEDQRHITGIDADGVALAAIQGLNLKLEGDLAAKEAQIIELQRAVEQLRQQVQRLDEHRAANAGH